MVQRSGEARAGGRGVQMSTVVTLFITVYHYFIKDFLHVGGAFAPPATTWLRQWSNVSKKLTITIIKIQREYIFSPKFTEYDH
jgi:hypothetical protein